MFEAPGASTFTLNRNNQEAIERTELVTNSFALSSSEDTLSKQKHGGLWRGHLATPKQSQLVFASTRKHKVTQADVLIELLRRARAEGRGLELTEIMAAGIAQHGARFNEIRARGYEVENQLQHAADGRVLSRYFLRKDIERDNQ